MTLTEMRRIAEQRTKGECWIWPGYINQRGYGQLTIESRSFKAHRFIFVLLRGPIADGFELDHLCRVRSCVNPDHLEPVIKRENILRGISFSAKNHAKTHCAKGHSFSGDNVAYPKRGGRYCLICRRNSSNANYARNKDRIRLRNLARKQRIAALESEGK